MVMGRRKSLAFSSSLVLKMKVNEDQLIELLLMLFRIAQHTDT